MERRICLFSVLLALVILLAVGCGGSMIPINRTTDLWDNNEHCAARTSSFQYDWEENMGRCMTLADSFRYYWKETGEAKRTLVMVQGKIHVGCGYGKYASLDAMAACKRNLTCYYKGIEHSIELFYSNGLTPLQDESIEDRKVCAACVCPTTL